MSWLSDLFEPRGFRCGPLSKPKKFQFLCCGEPVNMEIPCGMAEPYVVIECKRCGKGEAMLVGR